MKPLLLETSLPHAQLGEDIEPAKAQIKASCTLPPLDGYSADAACTLRLWFILELMQRNLTKQAAQAIDRLTFQTDSEAYLRSHPLMEAWLWLARMSAFIDTADYVLALGAAENSLHALASIKGKKSEDYRAILASLLYNLAYTHNLTGEKSRAAKELTHAQKQFERLAHKNGDRFSAMLVYSIEASTAVFKSRLKQMNVFAHYQASSELYSSMLKSGDKDATRQAMASLVDSLQHEGNIMLQMGNGRQAVKYYTKALRYQKKISDGMGQKELDLSIGLARALMRLVNRQAAAQQLLNSLVPLARRLGATQQQEEIESLLNNKNKNIMTLIKSLFMAAILVTSSLAASAQLIVGHRGSVWGVENTRAAFINGAKAGAWGLECDIYASKDGTFIINHDPTLQRLGGPATEFINMDVKDILAVPLREERQGKYYVGRVATLGEYLDICKEYNVVPVIEIKDRCQSIHSESGNPAANNFSGVPALINLIELKGLADKAVIISFMPETIEYIHKTYPNIAVQVLVGGDKNTEDYWIKWCKDRKIDLDIVSFRVNEKLVNELHKAGLKVNAWTVDDPAEFKRLQDLKCDFITTNAIFPKELK